VGVGCRIQEATLSIHDNIKAMAVNAIATISQWAAVLILAIVFRFIEAPWWMYILLVGTQIGTIRRWKRGIDSDFEDD
jgi:multisubunit Na+/H+ antiporter MnhG subunit